eukprot:gnl/TRDRNA2_/TRDRNA2_161862_c0_seq2.p1 gnl/TRDRNA2_/TRDRNA2_161862_c0~~gnl/TRDRNA2_/TRDRNA2_161862_c0_seq2.p1  ORF type:complete len:112 (-),score=5.81 gnl/TRDRNA2_/TRDRNA2_161862_c0_seq2:34-369(-)
MIPQRGTTTFRPTYNLWLRPEGPDERPWLRPAKGVSQSRRTCLHSEHRQHSNWCCTSYRKQHQGYSQQFDECVAVPKELHCNGNSEINCGCCLYDQRTKIALGRPKSKDCY